METTDKPLKTPQILIRVTGILFLLLAVAELILFVTGTRTSLGFIVLASVGIGMFEKHAWSRTLGIILSIWMLLGSSIFLFAYLFPQNGFLHIPARMAPSDFALSSVWFYLFFYAFTGYVLLRADIRKLFHANPQKGSTSQ